MSKDLKAPRNAILINGVNVLVRILKLALCHICPNEVVFERDRGREVLPIVKELR